MIADGDQRRARGQIVQQAGAGVEKQRQIVFGAARRAPLAEFGKYRAGVVIDLEARIPALLKGGNARLVEGKLARRQHVHPRQFLDGALGFRVEAAQAIDFIVEQVDAQRPGAAHGVEVQQRAAHGEFAVFVDGLHGAVAAFAQGGAQRRGIQHLSLGQIQAVGVDVVARGEALHQRRHRRQQQPLAQRGQARQRAQTFRDNVLMRRKIVVGQGFPVRQMQQLASVIQEKRQLAGQGLSLEGVRAQHGEKVVFAGQLGDAQRGAAAWKRPEGGSRAGLSGPWARGEQGGEAHSSRGVWRTGGVL